MITLAISLEGLSPPAGTPAAQQILVSHFKVRSVPLELARRGLPPSPGIVIVMPQGEEVLFTSNGEPLTLAPNTVLLLNGEDRNIVVFGRSKSRAAAAQPSISVIEINAKINDTSRLQDQAQLPFCLSSHDGKQMVDLYHSMVCRDHAIQLPPTGQDISLHLLASQIVSLILVAASQQPPTKRRTTQNEQLNRLRQFLLARLDQKITNTDMADHLRLSRSHFCKTAKSLLGESPARYLRRVRLERSLELLENTAESIESIADQIGYADRFHFSKEFKKRYGTSPAQFRKESSGSRQVSSYEKARSLFDHQRYEQALSMCEQAIATAAPGAELDPVIYLQGSCLSRLGRRNDALAVWDNLQHGPLAWQTAMQRCRLYFQSNNTEKALGELEQLWSQADGVQHGDVIQLWIEQVTSLRTQHRAKALRQYLDFRKKRFASDQQSKMLAVHTCRAIGNSMAILEHCLDDDGVRYRALASAGEYQQAHALYGRGVLEEQASRDLLASGRYDEVLALQPGIPLHKSRALVKLGRPQEAIDLYPEISVEAYFALGQYQRALETAPVPSHEHIYALYATGRIKELERYDIKGTWHWHLAQLYVRPERLLKVNYPETFELLPRARLLVALGEGKTKYEMLDQVYAIPHISSEEFWPQCLRYFNLLLRPVILHLLRENNDLPHDLQIVTKEWRHFDRQTLYYAASFLLGEIDAATWQQQPYQVQIVPWAIFLPTLKQDLQGNEAEACRGYREFLETTTPFPSENLILHRFAQWRLRARANRGT